MSEPREVTPMRFYDPMGQSPDDFRPVILPQDLEGSDSDPKDLSAPESAPSSTQQENLDGSPEQTSTQDEPKTDQKVQTGNPVLPDKTAPAVKAPTQVKVPVPSTRTS